MKIATVLRSGGEYEPCHVERLRRQILEFSPEADFICLSDVDCAGRIPLAHGWPGWWSKMELFSPEIGGDILYFDLDTTIRGPIDDIMSVGRLTLLRDFYRNDGLGSGMMYLPKDCRAEIWNAWLGDPTRHMRECGSGGDQRFLERFWIDKAARWQDLVPGRIISYKVHVRHAVMRGREFGNGSIPGGASVVCFHGKPRPWEVGW